MVFDILCLIKSISAVTNYNSSSCLDILENVIYRVVLFVVTTEPRAAAALFLCVTDVVLVAARLSKKMKTKMEVVVAATVMMMRKTTINLLMSPNLIRTEILSLSYYPKSPLL